MKKKETKIFTKSDVEKLLKKKELSKIVVEKRKEEARKHKDLCFLNQLYKLKKIAKYEFVKSNPVIWETKYLEKIGDFDIKHIAVKYLSNGMLNIMLPDYLRGENKLYYDYCQIDDSGNFLQGSVSCSTKKEMRMLEETFKNEKLQRLLKEEIINNEEAISVMLQEIISPIEEEKIEVEKTFKKIKELQKSTKFDFIENLKLLKEIEDKEEEDLREATGKWLVNWRKGLCGKTTIKLKNPINWGEDRVETIIAHYYMGEITFYIDNTWEIYQINKENEFYFDKKHSHMVLQLIREIRLKKNQKIISEMLQEVFEKEAKKVNEEIKEMFLQNF